LAQILFITRRFASKLGNFPTAEAYGKESVELFRELDEKRYLAWALRGLGGVYWERNERERGEPLLTEAMTLFQEVGDKRGLQFLLWDLGMVAIINDEYDRAMTLINESQSLAHELDDAEGIGWGLSILGLTAFLQGKLDEAEKALRESLILMHPFGSTDGYMMDLGVLAAIADKRRQPVRSARLWGAVQHLHEITGELFDYFWVQRVLEPMIASVRAQLGEAAFEAACAQGHAMTIDEAIDYALKETSG
jgi:tetratricopeptide (TPR) repeat protein